MALWTLAKKEFKLLARDRLGTAILFLMPFVFIVIMSLLTGEGFGQKADNRLRISLVDEDEGFPDTPEVRRATTWLTLTPLGGGFGYPAQIAGVVARDQTIQTIPRSWAQVVQRDLELTEGIRVEKIPSREQAAQLTQEGQRAAVIVFGPRFSDLMTRCSFLAEGLNPFYREGVNLDVLDAKLLADPTQATAAAIIGQVAQVTLLRVILPWMIGRAFDRLTDRSFMSMIADEIPAGRFLSEDVKLSLGRGVQSALKRLFPRYDLTGTNWADLTLSLPKDYQVGRAATFKQEGGSGFLHRGAARYQLIVPSMTVMFAFALVLTVGWLFVAEQHQGTLKRLRASPVSRFEILAGKLIPCWVLSVAQGLVLLMAGKWLFGLRWGPDSWPLWQQFAFLVPVVCATALAAMGLALLVAVMARTEIQVALFGTLLVFIMALLGGCLVPRALMPETMSWVMRFTPNAWALDAYNQLLISPTPNLMVVGRACLVLVVFGAVFLQLAWLRLRWR